MLKTARNGITILYSKLGKCEDVDSHILKMVPIFALGLLEMILENAFSINFDFFCLFSNTSNNQHRQSDRQSDNQQHEIEKENLKYCNTIYLLHFSKCLRRGPYIRAKNLFLAFKWEGAYIRGIYII